MTALTSAQQAFDWVHNPACHFERLKTLKISANFTWAEVFTGRTMEQIRTASLTIFQNAVQQAHRMETIRAYLVLKLGPNVVIDVSSWWRPQSVNKNIKGAATGSRHLLALATDFTVRGYATEAGNRKVQALLMFKFPLMSIEVTQGKWTHADDRNAVVFTPKKDAKGDTIGYRVLSQTERQQFIRRYAA